MTCNDKASFSSAKCVKYIKGCTTAGKFDLKIRGGNIIVCALKSQNNLADNTVSVTVVTRNFIQSPVFLVCKIRRWLVELRSVTSSLILASLKSYCFSVCHTFLI